MFGLFLIFPAIEMLGITSQKEAMFLHLAYDNHKDALSAKEMLEKLYGKGRVEVDNISRAFEEHTFTPA